MYHRVMCIPTVSGHLTSAVCELSVSMKVESYFRCVVKNIFTMMKSVLLYLVV